MEALYSGWMSYRSCLDDGHNHDQALADPAWYRLARGKEKTETHEHNIGMLR